MFDGSDLDDGFSIDDLGDDLVVVTEADVGDVLIATDEAEGEQQEEDQVTTDSSPKAGPVPVMHLLGASELSWQIKGNCMGVDPDLFFPERGASTREAKEVCRGCIVREDCLEYALANGEKFGIWGGLSERERRRLRRRRAIQARGLDDTSPEAVVTSMKAQPAVTPTPLTMPHFDALPASATLMEKVIAILQDYGGTIEHSGGHVCKVLRGHLGYSTGTEITKLSRCLASMDRRKFIHRETRNKKKNYAIRLLAVPVQFPQLPPAPASRRVRPRSSSLSKAEMIQAITLLLQSHGGVITDAGGSAGVILARELGLASNAGRQRLLLLLASMEAAGLIVRDKSQRRTYRIGLPVAVEPVSEKAQATPEPAPAKLNSGNAEELLIAHLRSVGGEIIDSSGRLLPSLFEAMGLTTDDEFRNMRATINRGVASFKFGRSGPATKPILLRLSSTLMIAS
jgi:WhiB family redox-sensing transcriptional regulator